MVFWMINLTMRIWEVLFLLFKNCFKAVWTRKYLRSVNQNAKRGAAIAGFEHFPDLCVIFVRGRHYALTRVYFMRYSL